MTYNGPKNQPKLSKCLNFETLDFFLVGFARARGPQPQKRFQLFSKGNPLSKNLLFGNGLIG